MNKNQEVGRNYSSNSMQQGIQAVKSGHCKYQQSKKPGDIEITY